MTQEEELIQLREENQVQREQLVQRDELIAQLLQRVQTLEERLSKNSHNSHLPPSSDRFVRQPRSLRKKSGKKPGGQAGHLGQSLRFAPNPDEVMVQTVDECQYCQANLQQVSARVGERRQVVDIPSPRVVVREYRSQAETVPAVPAHQCRSFSGRGTSPRAVRTTDRSDGGVSGTAASRAPGACV